MRDALTLFIDRLSAALWNRRARLLLRSLMTQTAPRLVRLGSDYGGWAVPEELLKPGFCCYCVGAGEDISLEEELLSKYGCEVHSFDPTPRAIAYFESCRSAMASLSFHPIGLWSENEKQRFYAPRNPRHVSHSITNIQGTANSFEAECKTVLTVMQDLGHDGIGLLKLDVEGAEHAVIDRMLSDGVRPDVVCVEMERPVRFVRFRKTVRNLVNEGYELVAADGFDLTFVCSDVAQQLAR